MNRSILNKIAFCLTLICSLQFAIAQVPTAQQQLYVTFGGGSLNDLSPNSYLVTPIGSPTPGIDRFGNPNCAMKLLPADKLSVQLSPFFDIIPGEDYSISMWYKGYTASISDLEMLFNKTDLANTPIQSDYHLCIYDLNKPYQGYYFSPVTFQPIAPGGGWHHLVGMYNNVGAVWTLYVDNVLAYNYNGPIVTSSPGDPVQIGGGYKGSVDDIVFYDRLLSITEVNQLFIDVNSCAIVCGCPVPTGLHFGGCVSVNTSIISWNANACATSYTVRIRNVTAAGPWVNYNSVTNNFNIATIPGNVYQVRVRSKCMAAGAISVSAYSPPISFTALACRTGEELIADGATYVFPNPASNEITIESYLSDAFISIIDLSGRVIVENQLTDHHATIPISDLPNGIYLIKIDNGTKSEIQKFVKTE